MAPVGKAAGVDTLSAGAATVDLTPQLGLGLAGHSVTAGKAQGYAGRLFASILVLDDGAEERVALVAVDLHAGSRWLTERAAELVAKTTGLTADRILLAASHTHRGPGNFYGNASYDRITAPIRGLEKNFDVQTAEALAQRLATGLRTAVANLAPAEVGWGSARAWQCVWNRSHAATLRNLPAVGDLDADEQPDEKPNRARAQQMWRALHGGEDPPGWDRDRAGSGFWSLPIYKDEPKFPLFASPPEELPEAATFEELVDRLAERPEPSGPTMAPFLGDEERSRTERFLADATVHCIWAQTAGPDPQPIGAIGILGATPALLGSEHDVYCADAFGEAVRVARDHYLANPLAGRPPDPALAPGATVWSIDQGTAGFPLGMANGACGDTNIVLPGLTVDALFARRKSMDGALWAIRRAGIHLGQALYDAMADAAANADDSLTLALAFSERPTADASVRAFGGAPTHRLASKARFGASTFAASEFGGGLPGFREGMRTPGFQAAEPHSPKPLLPVLGIAQATLPARVLRLEGASRRAVFVANPGEVSTWLAHEITTRISADPSTTVIHLGPSGDYCSYFPTWHEYMAQHYEGASTVWGRWFGGWLVDRVDELIGSTRTEPTGSATFTGEARPAPHANLPGPAQRRRVPLPRSLRELAQGDELHALHVHRSGSQVTLRGRWTGPETSTTPAPWDGPWWVVEAPDATGAHKPLVHLGSVVDDRNSGATLLRWPLDGRTAWLWELVLDDAATVPDGLAFRVLAPAPVAPTDGTLRIQSSPAPSGPSIAASHVPEPVVGPQQVLHTSEGHPVPWYVLTFDKRGACTSPMARNHLLAHVGTATDVFLFSHGWNNTYDDAMSSYRAFLDGYRQLLAARPGTRPWRPVLVGVSWPSIALLLPGQKTPDIAGERLLPDVQAIADELDEASAARLLELAELEELTPEVADELAHLLAPAFDGATPEELREVWATAESLDPGPEAAISLKDVLLSPVWAVRMATVYQMKDRAGVVGTHGVGPVLEALVESGARVHGIGHSYGCKVLLSATATLKAGSAVRSLLLLQPAVNRWAFAPQLPKGGGAGGYHHVLDRVEQPIVMTWSKHDGPLRWAFPAAVRRKSDLGELKIAGGDSRKGPVYGGLGGWGPAGTPHTSLTMPKVNQPYPLDDGPRLISVDATRVIRGHSDLEHPEVWWALRYLVEGPSAGGGNASDTNGSGPSIGLGTFDHLDEE